MRFCSNFSPHERLALQSLKEMQDITIKPADKGGAIVIMDKIDYDNYPIQTHTSDSSIKNTQYCPILPVTGHH